MPSLFDVAPHIWDGERPPWPGRGTRGHHGRHVSEFLLLHGPQSEKVAQGAKRSGASTPTPTPNAMKPPVGAQCNATMRRGRAGAAGAAGPAGAIAQQAAHGPAQCHQNSKIIGTMHTIGPRGSAGCLGDGCPCHPRAWYHGLTTPASMQSEGIITSNMFAARSRDLAVRAVRARGTHARCTPASLQAHAPRGLAPAPPASPLPSHVTRPAPAAVCCSEQHARAR